MRAYKVIVMVALVMIVFTMLLVPMQEGVFPSWLNTAWIEFFLILLCACCALALIK